MEGMLFKASLLGCQLPTSGTGHPGGTSGLVSSGVCCVPGFSAAVFAHALLFLRTLLQIFHPLKTTMVYLVITMGVSRTFWKGRYLAELIHLREPLMEMM